MFDYHVYLHQSLVTRYFQQGSPRHELVTLTHTHWWALDFNSNVTFTHGNCSACQLMNLGWGKMSGCTHNRVYLTISVAVYWYLQLLSCAGWNYLHVLDGSFCGTVTKKPHLDTRRRRNQVQWKMVRLWTQLSMNIWNILPRSHKFPAIGYIQRMPEIVAMCCHIVMLLVSLVLHSL